MRIALQSRGSVALPHIYTDEELEQMAAEWRRYGHERDSIRKETDGLRISIGDTVLQVQTGLVTFHGPVSDDAIAAGIRHAQDAWNGRMSVHGDNEDFKLRTWAHAQVAGVEVGNYTPPPHLMHEANSLVSKLGVEMFNRKHGGCNDGIIGGLKDDRPWGYRAGTPTPRDQEMMRRVERAMGMGTRHTEDITI